MRGSAAALVLALLLASGCAGPAGPLDQPVGDEDTSAEACLAGRVLTEDLLPLANATVEIVTRANQTLADGDGGFAFCHIPDGAYTLQASKPGFLAQTRRVDHPSPEPIEFRLAAAPVLKPRVEVLPFTVFYQVGHSSLDTTAGRDGLPVPTCGPCDFRFDVAALPDIVFLEADWERTVAPPAGQSDIMYHIFRAGAPFAEGVDVGSGSKSKPFAFNYPRSELNPDGAAQGAEGQFSFSGSVYCSGNAPCVDQRIDVWVSLFYDYLDVPRGYTALQGS